MSLQILTGASTITPIACAIHPPAREPRKMVPCAQSCAKLQSRSSTAATTTASGARTTTGSARNKGTQATTSSANVGSSLPHDSHTFTS